MLKKLLYLFFALVPLVSCGKGSGAASGRNSGEDAVLTATGDVWGITECSANLCGYANPSLEWGMLYSKDPVPSKENGVEVYSRSMDASNMYTIAAGNLSSNTLYYYRSFAQFSGIYRYGEVKQFMTFAVKARLEYTEVTDLTSVSATINGKLALECRADLPRTVRIYYSNTIDDAAELIKKGLKKDAGLEDSGIFKCYLDWLKFGKVYHYIPVATVYDKILTGEMESFRTNPSAD